MYYLATRLNIMFLNNYVQYTIINNMLIIILYKKKQNM